MRATDLLRAAVEFKTAAEYTVRSGDTLGHIARRHNTDVSTLASLNAIPNPNRIRSGAVLRLPQAQAPVQPQAQPQPQPQAQPQHQPQAQPQAQPQPRAQPQHQPQARAQARDWGSLQEISVPKGKAWNREARRAVQQASRKGRLFDGPRPPLPRDISPQGLAGFVGHWEGFEPQAYRDSRGLLTVGYGTLLEGRPDNQRWLRELGGRVTPEQAARRKQEDLVEYIAAARRNQPGFDDLPPEVQGLVVDLNYNLGPQGYRGFGNTRAALARGDWDTAADELIDSDWFSQVGRRSRHHVDVLRDLARHRPRR